MPQLCRYVKSSPTNQQTVGWIFSLLSLHNIVAAVITDLKMNRRVRHVMSGAIYCLWGHNNTLASHYHEVRDYLGIPDNKSLLSVHAVLPQTTVTGIFIFAGSSATSFLTLV